MTWGKEKKELKRKGVSAWKGVDEVNFKAFILT